MSSDRRSLSTATIAAMVALSVAPLRAQVTTASLGGRVTTATGAPVPTATVTAVHQPSGTTYRATPRADGRFTIPGMRVGGPYVVTVRALGYSPGSRQGIALTLGNQTQLDFTLSQAALQLQGVQVTATAGALSSERTGAQTRIATEAIRQLPTISRTINDFTRLTPQASGGGGFLGQDNRLNNITVDGSFFNNSFGLAGQPGGRTNVAPIPLDAIEQLQVNIAPYDIRQGNFVGAGVNAVTRSGRTTSRGRSTTSPATSRSTARRPARTRCRAARSTSRRWAPASAARSSATASSSSRASRTTGCSSRARSSSRAPTRRSRQSATSRACWPAT
jgi:hypothetical protein